MHGFNEQCTFGIQLGTLNKAFFLRRSFKMFNRQRIVLRTPVSLHFDTALNEELAPKHISDGSETPRIVVTQCNAGGVATKEGKQAKVLLSASDIGVLDDEAINTETPMYDSSSKDQSKEENKLEVKVEEQIDELNCSCPPRVTNTNLNHTENKEYKLSLFQTPPEGPKQRPSRPTSNKESLRKVSYSKIRKADSPQSKSAGALRPRNKRQ